MEKKKWLQLRKNFIGASDAPVIMNGEHFGKTPYKLWQEKLGLLKEEDPNIHMKRGLELEATARVEYESKSGIKVTPEVIYSPDNDFMMASLDGLSTDKTMAVEIKCPGEKDHEIAKSGNIPEKYIPQLQHQMACLCTGKMHYFSYRYGEGILITMLRDDKYIKKLIKKEREFWDHVMNYTPPPVAEKDYIKMQDAEWDKLTEEWKSINSQLIKAKERESTLRSQLLEKSGWHNCRGNGVKITISQTRGNVDYSQIPELNNVDLEKYRKKSYRKHIFSLDKKEI